MGGRLSGDEHSRVVEWLCGGTISPCAKDCHSVAIEMHNTFAVISADEPLLKAISMIRFILEKKRKCVHFDSFGWVMSRKVSSKQAPARAAPFDPHDCLCAFDPSEHPTRARLSESHSRVNNWSSFCVQQYSWPAVRSVAVEYKRPRGGVLACALHKTSPWQPLKVTKVDADMRL